MSTMPFVALWGDEHPDLGVVAIERLGRRAAVALSRGRMPKPYWHLDLNEDAALAVGGRRRLLLAVADGHHGADAAIHSLTSVYRTALRLLDTPTDSADVVTAAFTAASEDLAVAMSDIEQERRGSRTALTVTVIERDHVWASTLGDTVAIRIRGNKGKQLTGTGPFLGPRSPAPEPHSARMRRGDALVVASDGLVDFIPQPWDESVARVMDGVRDPAVSAKRLIDTALRAGASDNVTVGVARA